MPKARPQNRDRVSSDSLKEQSRPDRGEGRVAFTDRPDGYRLFSLPHLPRFVTWSTFYKHLITYLVWMCGICASGVDNGRLYKYPFP